jgi:hypothetical protein
MHKIRIAVLSSVMLILSGCVMAVVERDQYPGVEEFQETIPFEPDGDITLINFDGNIEITGWEQREVEIYAEIHPDIPRRGRIEFMWKNRRIPQVNVEDFDGAVKISTRAPSETGALVDYFLKVPRSIQLEDIIAREGRIFISGVYGSIRAEIASGEIEVENFSGSLSALVTRGSISAGLYDLRKEDDIILNCREGDITLYLQEGVPVTIHAEAPKGEIMDEFQLSREEEGLINTQIGEGGAAIRMTALNGDIHINKIALGR